MGLWNIISKSPFEGNKIVIICQKADKIADTDLILLWDIGHIRGGGGTLIRQCAAMVAEKKVS